MAAPAAFGPRWLEDRLSTLLDDAAPPRLCVAYSGGPDSLALLAALAALRDAGSAALRLRAIHVDHGLHADSGAWAAWCRKVCRSLGVPLTVRKARLSPLGGESIEALAREARYRLLAEALHDGEVLLTAQHLDDQAETVLLQLLRGAGIAGLAAMSTLRPLGRGRLLRPLLDRPREELAGWLESRGLPALDDPMNRDPRWARARLRHEVMPVLERRWPGAAGTIARSARHAAEAQELLAELATQDLALARDGVALLVTVVRRWPAARRRNALRQWIIEAGVTPPDTSRLEEIAGPLLAARADALPAVRWPAACVRREAGRLWISKTAARGLAAPATLAWSWQARRKATLEGEFGMLRIAPDPQGPIDLGSLPASLEVRMRKGGESLRPRRGGPSRTAKFLLQEGGVPPASRARMPFILAAGRLIAIGDRWIDASVQAGASTRRRGRILWRAPVTAT